MPIKIKRWYDPRETEDGHRLLVCRYRPRALLKKDETWDEWNRHLGPSRELHADAYGKKGDPIGWEEFRQRYIQEMTEQKETIRELAHRVKKGETITLLCSSQCVDETRCHRSLLKELIETQMKSDDSDL